MKVGVVAHRNCKRNNRSIGRPTNDSVHPARAMKVSISNAPDRGLGCNGWFVDSLRKFEDDTILSFFAAETMIIEYTANDVKESFAFVIAGKLQIVKNGDHI